MYQPNALPNKAGVTDAVNEKGRLARSHNFADVIF